MAVRRVHDEQVDPRLEQGGGLAGDVAVDPDRGGDAQSPAGVGVRGVEAGTQGPGKFELELGTATSHDHGSRIVELDPQLSYGALANHQLGSLKARGARAAWLLGVALAYTLLVVFSHIFRSPDGGPMFTAQLAPMLVLQATLLACIVGLVAAVIPARRAARMDPVQAIRA